MSDKKQYQPQYASSVDFTNLEEPPKPLETPDLSALNLHNSSSNTASRNEFIPQVPRRRSTNYVDALQSELEHPPAAIEIRPETNRRDSSGSMNEQFTKHELQRGSTDLGNGEYYSKYNNVDMGDHIHKDALDTTEKGRDRSEERRAGHLKKRNPFGISFNNYHDKGRSDTEEPEYVSPPHIGRRRSSLVYEDFKKDIYNKLHLFGKWNQQRKNEKKKGYGARTKE